MEKDLRLLVYIEYSIVQYSIIKSGKFNAKIYNNTIKAEIFRIFSFILSLLFKN